MGKPSKNTQPKKKVDIQVKPNTKETLEDLKTKLKDESSDENQSESSDENQSESSDENQSESTDENQSESTDEEYDKTDEEILDQLEEEPVKEVTGFERAFGADNIKCILNCTAQPATQLDETYSRLYIVIMNQLGLCKDDKFAENLQEIYKFIKENPVPFSSLYAMRGIPNITMLSDAQLRELEITLRILIDTTDPSSRKVTAKAMSWARVGEIYSKANSKVLIPRFKAFFAQ